MEIVGRGAMCNEGLAHVCVAGTGRGTGSDNGEGAEGAGVASNGIGGNACEMSRCGVATAGEFTI